jgi:hypothetical protein
MDPPGCQDQCTGVFKGYFSPYPYTLEESSDYLSDIDILDEFLLLSLPTEHYLPCDILLEKSSSRP